MWERYGFARTLLVKNVAAVSTMVFPVGKGEGCSTSHTDVAVGPFGRSTAINHTAGYFGLGWELETFSLQGLVDLVDICQVVSALRGTGPVLG